MPATPRYYKYTRSLDPKTGNVIMDGLTWKGGSPMAEVVLRVLRTPKGAYLPDPNFGFDYSLIKHLESDSESKVEAGIRNCLDYLVKAKLIIRLEVKVEVDSKKKACLFDVSFIDPLLKKRVSVKDKF